MTKRPPVATRGKDDPKGEPMTALLQHTTERPHPSPGIQRFAGDWVDAVVVLGHGTIRVDAGNEGHILIPEDFETLREALAVPEPTERRPRRGPGPVVRPGVQFNAALGILLVPGGHDRAGRSFFRVSRAGS